MRRLILLSAFFCCITTLATAQIEKGRIQLEGSFLYQNRDDNNFNNTFFSINPHIGFFISDNISIGPSLQFTRLVSDLPNLDDVTQNQLQYGAFARFHKSIADNFYLFAETSFRLGTGKTEDQITGNSDFNSFNFNIRPGIQYFLSDKFTLSANLNFFNYYREKNEGINQTELTVTNIGTSLSSVGLGISYFLK